MRMASYFTMDATSSETSNFQKEISNMMHGFGDNPNPNAATVVLVENIVLQQLKSLVQEAYKISITRDSRYITNYEVIFLMRKNILKMKRLYDYQIRLEQIDKRISVIPNEKIMMLDDDDPSVKKKRTHIDVIRELDETREIDLIKFDAIDYLRKIRAFKITETMSFDKYENYHKARCSSFRGTNSLNRGYIKLEKWINANKEYKIAISALEVLGFIAYETVADLVDSVYLIRQDAKKKPGDPFSKFEGGYFCNPGALNNAVYIKSGFEGVPAITVAEIREALRRYFSPTTGLNGLFYRNMGLDLPVRYITL